MLNDFNLLLSCGYFPQDIQALGLELGESDLSCVHAGKLKDVYLQSRRGGVLVNQSPC